MMTTLRMLLILAWRNIWRNPRRSLAMMMALTIGLWAGLFVVSLSMGMMDQRFRTSILQQFSHIQIHHPEYPADQQLTHSISDVLRLNEALRQHAQVKAYSMRTIVTGMISSPTLSSGIRLMGVDPDMESLTTRLPERIIVGEYLRKDQRQPVLIGKSLAEKMKAEVGSKMVVTFQDQKGDVVSVLFRVAGIFQSSSSMFDAQHAYVLRDHLAEYLGDSNLVHEVAIVCHDLEQVQGIAERLRNQFPDLLVRPWNELSPELSFLQESSRWMMTIIVGIILAAVAFGLLNTILMSVFERVRELGMLMAVGMNRRRVFGMILLETILLTATGGILGMLAGFLTIVALQPVGIDFSSVGGESLELYGFDSVVYPYLDTGFFFIVSVMTILTAILTALYPALKAIRLRPVEAIRKD